MNELSLAHIIIDEIDKEFADIFREDIIKELDKELLDKLKEDIKYER